jgi:trimeric autotransporter adhesin
MLNNHIKIKKIRRLILFPILFHLVPGISAQVIIKATVPNYDCILEVNSDSSGILIPRMTTAQRTSIYDPADGLLLFDTDTHSFWYTQNSSWTEISDTVSFYGWMINGNTGTNPGSDYLGTSNNRPLVFKTSNEPSGIIDPYGATFFGYHSGTFNLDSTNTGLGMEALDSNTCGWYNTAVGRSSMKANLNGYQNTAAGASSLYWNRNNYNTALGSGSLSNNSIGIKNTAIGSSTLFNNYSGNNNTGIGYLSLNGNNFGSANTAGGIYALNMTIGDDNTAFGYKTLSNNTSGYNNTAFGSMALQGNNGNYNSTAIGYHAMARSDNTISGNNTFNTAVGYMALEGSSDPSYNTGTRNTAIGYASLLVNKNGNLNIAIGSLSQSSHASGNVNIAFGYQSLIGEYLDSNIAIGYQASLYSIWGHNNIAIGNQACLNHIRGYFNIGIGILSALNINHVFSSDNIAIGGWTLNNVYTVNTWYNVCIGDHADLNYEGYWGAMALGSYASAIATNSAKFGNASVSTIGGYANWSIYSDIRLKENIIYKDEPGLDFILKLKPVSYNYIEDVNKVRRDGLIAQDVQQALDELKQEFSGLIINQDKDCTMSISYSLLIIPLINAMQEQNEMLVEHENQLLRLKEKVEDINKK